MHRAARLLVLLLLTAAGVRAHPILQNPVWIESGKDGLTLNLDVSVRELVVVQSLPLTAQGGVDLDEAIERANRHTGYLLDHFQVKADGELLKGTVTKIVPPKQVGSDKESPDNAHFRYTIDYHFDTVPAVLTFSQNMCVEFPSAPGIPWDLSYAYRYGPRGETPRKLGPLRYGEELSFTTGFVRIRNPMPALLLGLWAAFLAVCVLGSSVPAGARYPYIAAVMTWVAGLVLCKYLAAGFPAWPVLLLCGTVTILTSADNIHRSTAGTRRRRTVLLYAGCLFFGAAFGLQERHFPNLDTFWHLLPLPVALAAVLIAGGLAVFLKRRAGSTAAACTLQLTSLACCGAAVWLMLRLLEVL